MFDISNILKGFRIYYVTSIFHLLRYWNNFEVSKYFDALFWGIKIFQKPIFMTTTVECGSLILLKGIIFSLLLLLRRKEKVSHFPKCHHHYLKAILVNYMFYACDILHCIAKLLRFFKLTAWIKYWKLLLANKHAIFNNTALCALQVNRDLVIIRKGGFHNVATLRLISNVFHVSGAFRNTWTHL